MHIYIQYYSVVQHLKPQRYSIRSRSSPSPDEALVWFTKSTPGDDDPLVMTNSSPWKIHHF